MAVDASGTLYVGANTGSNTTVTAYPAGSSTPSLTITSSGSFCEFGSAGVAVDASGTLYVANCSNVTEYSAGSTTPSGVTIPTGGGLYGGAGVAVDAARTLYVASNNTVTEYPGSTTPNATIHNISESFGGSVEPISQPCLAPSCRDNESIALLASSAKPNAARD